MSVLLALLKRDLMLAARQGGGAGTAIGFFLTVVVLLPLGLGPDQNLLQRIAPGALWIALLLSVLLSAERIFLQDYEDGSLDLMTMGPASFELVTLTKAVAHWLMAGLPLSIAAPVLGFLLNIAPDQILPLALAMLTGSLALSFLATLGAAVTVGLRRGGPLVSLLVLPIYIPVLIFGVSASGAPDAPGGAAAALLILAALSLTALIVAPVASAAALRAYLR